MTLVETLLWYDDLRHFWYDVCGNLALCILWHIQKIKRTKRLLRTPWLNTATNSRCSHHYFYGYIARGWRHTRTCPIHDIHNHIIFYTWIIYVPQIETWCAVSPSTVQLSCFGFNRRRRWNSFVLFKSFKFSKAIAYTYTAVKFKPYWVCWDLGLMSHKVFLGREV